MKERLQGSDGFLVIRGSPLVYGTDQDVFWRVFHIDEFQKLCAVAAGFQALGAEGVGE